ncbi:hypothetical protein FACS1894141_1690 [Spirochaetia bacterium]|nr:hypothetical protein FACS1894141_1690 [Spirochaetia bacterium]
MGKGKSSNIKKNGYQADVTNVTDKKNVCKTVVKTRTGIRDIFQRLFRNKPQKSSSGTDDDTTNEPVSVLETENHVRGSEEGQPDPIIQDIKPWQSVGESVVGMAHRRGAVPVVCQDAYCINNSKRTILVVCDGAGSATMSEIGSQNVSQSVVRFLFSLEHIMAKVLDSIDSMFPIDDTLLSKMIYRYSIQTLKDLSLNYRREVKDFRTTLLIFITGEKRAFWLKVGDGEIVIENNNTLQRVGTSIKGEYSNETVFIDEKLNYNDVQYGLVDMSSVLGVAIMSDGSSERLVSTDGKKIAGRLSEYFEMLRNSKLSREELYKFLNDYEVWKGSTHDDKTLVLASR